METVVALTVILAAVVGPVSLITRGLLSFSFSKNKVIAIHLAQEGIELVRLVRDNNIACDAINGPAVQQWNKDPEHGTMGGTVGVDVGDLVDGEITIECGDATLVMPKLSASCATPLHFDGTYGYQSGTATIFTRCIQIQTPVPRPLAGGDGDEDIPAADQMNIISTVTWEERGIEQQVVLRERLYDWR